jgi:hypothetical protein
LFVDGNESITDRTGKNLADPWEGNTLGTGEYFGGGNWIDTKTNRYVNGF